MNIGTPTVNAQHGSLYSSAESSSEIARRANFSRIRYAQCWEDADILLNALAVRQGDTCLSIASAGDNSLSLLTNSPAAVTAIDLNPAQLALLELKAMAFKVLDYEEMLTFLGIRDGNRLGLFKRVRSELSHEARDFWNARRDAIAGGVCNHGKFEHYFAIFRKFVLPLVHTEEDVASLLSDKSGAERVHFYKSTWNSPAWRALFRVFFSRNVMGMLGRDPAFFAYVNDDVPAALLKRTEHALTILNPSANPYLQWILTGTFTTVLPHYLRRENFEAIRANLHRLRWQLIALEDYLKQAGSNSIDVFNLSDVFEYMSEQHYHELLRKLACSGKRGGRLAYWNMLAPRTRPEFLGHLLKSHAQRAANLHSQDKAFFYSRFVLEEIIC